MNQTILLVEDNPDDVQLFRMALKQAGFHNPLVVLSDGQQAIEYLKGEGPYADRVQFPFPQLVLLDLKMPRMSGFEVLTWLRHRPEWKGLPVIVLTSSCYEPDVRHAYELGANSFVTKPDDFAAFVGTVKQMANFWLAKAVLPQAPAILPPSSGPPSPPGSISSQD